MAVTSQQEGNYCWSKFAQAVGYLAAAYTAVVLAVATARAFSHRIEDYNELEQVVRDEQFQSNCSVPIIPRFDRTTYALQRKRGEYELNIAGSDPREFAVRKTVRDICQHYAGNPNPI